jgi:hydroxymethylglutaryl-CoA reductase (NADPH)
MGTINQLNKWQQNSGDAGRRYNKIDRVPERGLHTEKARLLRCHYLKDKTGIDLSLISPRQLVPEDLKNNIESFIGAVELPVGIAGPLHLIGSDFDEMLLAPIVTSEGALVASISRGAYAINLAGGCHARFVKQRMNRVPVFHFLSLTDAHSFASWCLQKLDSVQTIVKKFSCFAELKSLTTRIAGRSVHVNFSYQTGDAAGQNMTTTCTWHACQWLAEHWRAETNIPIESYTVEGNGSGDKKVSFANFFEGRGCEVVAECTIPGDILKRVLKVTPRQFHDAFQRAANQSCTLGMIGYNINVSNLVAGIFTATGQDIACVHESSLANLYVELKDDNLYASIQLPSLVIGTVGGGTNLPAQRKLLQLIDCSGTGKVRRFAEIIAGFAMALELSTGSAVIGGQFAMAHEKYGRNRPIFWMNQGELEEEILPAFLCNYLGGQSPEGLKIRENCDFQIGDNILSELCRNHLKKKVGIFPYDLSFTSNGRKETLKTIVKLKALDTELQQIGIKMAAMGSMELAELFRKHAFKTGFANCHKKELAICRQTHKNFTGHVPETYHTLVDEKREIYLLITKRLEDTLLKDCADNFRLWKPEYLEQVMKSAASFHSVWFDRNHLQLEKEYYVEKRLTVADYCEMGPFFLALLNNAVNEFPEIVTPEHYQTISGIIDRMDSWVPFYSNLPATLIHNDFNPRNIAIQNGGTEPRAFIYDWELASIGIPQRDIAEFLCFVLGSDTGVDPCRKYVELHRRHLESLVGRNIDKSEWMRGFHFALFDFITCRLLLYLMAHTLKDYKFMDRVFETSMFLVNKFENESCNSCI